jgi:2'-5' RNA ligase
MLRVFFALWPDDAARQRLAAAARDVAARTQGGGRRLPRICTSRSRSSARSRPSASARCARSCVAAASAEPFVLTLDCAGTFRENGNRVGRRVVVAATARRSRAQPSPRAYGAQGFPSTSALSLRT